MTLKPAQFPPRVWLRRVDVIDIVECGEGCEADVQTLYAPQSMIVTGMDQYLSKAESDELVRQARASAFEEMYQFTLGTDWRKQTVIRKWLMDKAAEARGE